MVHKMIGVSDSLYREKNVKLNNSKNCKTFIQGVMCTDMEHQEKTWIIGLSVPFYG